MLWCTEGGDGDGGGNGATLLLLHGLRGTAELWSGAAVAETARRRVSGPLVVLGHSLACLDLAMAALAAHKSRSAG